MLAQLPEFQQEGTKSIEGCPVTLLQDRGKHVKNFLMAIYDPA